MPPHTPAERHCATCTCVPPPLLTPREAEILTLFSSGLPVHTIGDQCCISAKTVESHLKNVARKLKVRGYGVALVHVATQQGLIACPCPHDTLHPEEGAA